MLETVIALITTVLLFFKEELKAWFKGRSR